MSEDPYEIRVGTDSQLKGAPIDPLLYFEGVCRELQQVQYELEFVAWPDEIRRRKEWHESILIVLRDRCRAFFGLGEP